MDPASFGHMVRMRKKPVNGPEEMKSKRRAVEPCFWAAKSSAAIALPKGSMLAFWGVVWLVGQLVCLRWFSLFLYYTGTRYLLD